MKTISFFEKLRNEYDLGIRRNDESPNNDNQSNENPEKPRIELLLVKKPVPQTNKSKNLSFPKLNEQKPGKKNQESINMLLRGKCLLDEINFSFRSNKIRTKIKIRASSQGSNR